MLGKKDLYFQIHVGGAPMISFLKCQKKRYCTSKFRYNSINLTEVIFVMVKKVELRNNRKIHDLQ